MAIDSALSGRPLRGLVVAAPRSGSGKTLFTLGLLAALARRGHTVQAFKAGPDFIDPGHHAAITGRPSHNLDGWILGRNASRAIFSSAVRQEIDGRTPDFVLVEGVMGLFDGASGREETGSTAELAKWLGLPVLLTMDVRSMARTAAALAYGLAAFDPDLPMAGVALNRVSSANHRVLLEEAFEGLDKPRLLGCLMNDPELEVPARHLGLVTAHDRPLDEEFTTRLADWVESSLDLDALLESLPSLSTFLDDAEAADEEGETVSVESEQSSGDADESSNNLDITPTGGAVRIAVARDAAFCFYYEENLRLLARSGAEIVFFSPLTDAALPDGAVGLYLGGGYPELHAETLSHNVRLREMIRKRAAKGMPVYAECGGYMYLMRSLTDIEGRRQLMAGVFPWASRMDTRRRGLGYREVTTTEDTILGPAGTVVRGHEFHYSHVAETPDETTLLDAGVQPVYLVTDRKGAPVSVTGYRAGDVLASYVHLHFGSNPQAAEAFVTKCRIHWNDNNAR